MGGDRCTLLGHVAVEVFLGSEAAEEVFGHVALELTAGVDHVSSEVMMIVRCVLTVLGSGSRRYLLLDSLLRGSNLIVSGYRPTARIRIIG